MGYSVRVTPSVRERLKSTVNYLVEVRCDSQYARRLLDGVEAAIGSFKSDALFPIIDIRASGLVGRSVYKRKVGSYKLLYVIDEQEKSICIFSFINDRQDGRHIISADYRN